MYCKDSVTIHIDFLGDSCALRCCFSSLYRKTNPYICISEYMYGEDIPLPPQPPHPLVPYTGVIFKPGM